MEATEEDQQRDVDYAEARDEDPDVTLKWYPDAMEKVKRIPIPFVREMAVKRIEQEVQKAGHAEVTLDLFLKYRFTF